MDTDSFIGCRLQHKKKKNTYQNNQVDWPLVQKRPSRGQILQCKSKCIQWFQLSNILTKNCQKCPILIKNANLQNGKFFQKMKFFHQELETLNVSMLQRSSNHLISNSAKDWSSSQHFVLHHPYI